MDRELHHSAATVVVVDHSAAAISHYRASLRLLPVKLVGFRDSDEALGYLRDHRPALVLVDLVMPEKDGISLLRELRDLPHHQNTPVVVVTSKDYAQDRAAARALGVAEFLPKPLRGRDIRSMVARHAGLATTPAGTGPPG